jgi:hypothetical protein
MKALQDVRTEVRVYLDESSQQDFLDTEVLMAINKAYQDVAGSVMEVYEQYYETTTPFTYALVANQQEYIIDPTIVKPTRVEVNFQPNVLPAVSSRLIPIKMNEVRGNMANTNPMGSFFSAGYYIHGDQGTQKIGFIPIPTVGDTTGHSISVWGITMPTDLINNTDNVNIPYVDRFVYLVSLRAAAQLMRKGQQEENNAQNYINEYEKGITQMKSFLKDRTADDVTMIVDVLGDDLDFTTMEAF